MSCKQNHIHLLEIPAKEHLHEISFSNLADLQKATLAMQGTEGHGCYSMQAESYTRLLRQNC